MSTEQTQHPVKQNAPVSSGLITYPEVQEKIVVIRGMEVIADADVAALYGVQTREINQAVGNNPDKFPSSFCFVLENNEIQYLRSNVLTTKVSRKSRTPTNVFTEKGLYMLATILKSKRAKDVTFAIIETFAQVQNIKKELVDLHQEQDPQKQSEKIKHFGEVLSDIVMPDLQTTETESTLEINFVVGKLKHTVKRRR